MKLHLKELDNNRNRLQTSIQFSSYLPVIRILLSIIKNNLSQFH